MEGVTIVAATAADVPAVHRIEAESFPAPWRQEFFAGELQAPGRLNLVAKRDDRVIGYLFSMWLFEELHVNKIAVVEPERRQGIADELMARCFAFARENGIESVSLEVRQSNDGAQAFYRKLGFKATYLRPRYYPDGEAAVVMSRTV